LATTRNQLGLAGRDAGPYYNLVAAGLRAGELCASMACAESIDLFRPPEPRETRGQWWDRHLACHFLIERQHETVSKPEIRLGHDAVLYGTVLEPPEIRAQRAAPLRQELCGEHFETIPDACPTKPRSEILFHRLQPKNASPKLQIGPIRHRKEQTSETSRISNQPASKTSRRVCSNSVI
jgi:hypothetical protein